MQQRADDKNKREKPKKKIWLKYFLTLSQFMRGILQYSKKRQLERIQSLAIVEVNQWQKY